MKTNHGWTGKNIVSIDQFSTDDILQIFSVALEMKRVVLKRGGTDILKGKILANLFYEHSTRTASSFTAAMQRLGGTVIPINEVKYSSVSKGETLVDTIRTLCSYSDVIALRHPQVGSASLATTISNKPIINAGDGVGEHPTQALLDLFTIVQELNLGVSEEFTLHGVKHSSLSELNLKGLNVILLGDLLHGRTVHSLSKLLSLYGVTVHLVSPRVLAMPQTICDHLQSRGSKVFTYESLEDALPHGDVLYVTRVQKERFNDESLYERVKDSYVITPETMNKAKSKMVLMHPFPRVNEISFEVDSDPRAAYFRQMENGMYLRMALLAMVVNE